MSSRFKSCSSGSIDLWATPLIWIISRHVVAVGILRLAVCRDCSRRKDDIGRPCSRFLSLRALQIGHGGNRRDQAGIRRGFEDSQ
ncbi:hypothetical protein B0H11DRAFT_2280963 [Mycena galericulata]|nr:hypothetical protein B0H11DRAFT_2289053 [Mycena galericulata]KAJ7460982.1 hypothetical protein B0H11DRAFT_2286061 [Mycena galericulata]KAJ7475440.1 hypothetical protein B0H11DRAFT_2281962 [Mycena galericulata]KAJ7478847.1 hypothetical protein B0H11DRAFT_2280963 [Mycena galericulata]